MNDPQSAVLHLSDGRNLAYLLREGTNRAGSPMLLFLPGYASDMGGTKALALDAFAAERGLAMLRFDYSGTGSSGGEFGAGTLGLWLGETLEMVDRLTAGRLILAGSSMGGWIALHVALQRPDRIAALVGIAAAPDFTEWGFSEEDKERIARDGRLEQPNLYGDQPHITTLGFWQSGQQMRLLDREIAVDCPVRLIHGEADEEVPVDIALRLLAALRSADVQLNIVKGGGHRLSAPHEIAAILRAIDGLLETDL